MAHLKSEVPSGVYGAILKLLFALPQLLMHENHNRGQKMGVS
jgi:hypothetical protein